jgi:hypothetical protein
LFWKTSCRNNATITFRSGFCRRFICKQSLLFNQKLKKSTKIKTNQWHQNKSAAFHSPFVFEIAFFPLLKTRALITTVQKITSFTYLRDLFLQQLLSSLEYQFHSITSILFIIVKIHRCFFLHSLMIDEFCIRLLNSDLLSMHRLMHKYVITKQLLILQVNVVRIFIQI